MSRVLVVGGERNGETIEWFGNRVYINGVEHLLNRIVFKDGTMVERYVKVGIRLLLTNKITRIEVLG